MFLPRGLRGLPIRLSSGLQGNLRGLPIRLRGLRAFKATFAAFRSAFAAFAAFRSAFAAAFAALRSFLAETFAGFPAVLAAALAAFAALRSCFRAASAALRSLRAAAFAAVRPPFVGPASPNTPATGSPANGSAGEAVPSLSSELVIEGSLLATAARRARGPLVGTVCPTRAPGGTQARTTRRAAPLLTGR